MILSKEVYNSYALEGQFVKFSIPSNGSVTITTSDPGETVTTSELMFLRSSTKPKFDIEDYLDGEFSGFTPSIILGPDNNSQTLTKGNYAVKLAAAGDVTVFIEWDSNGIAEDQRIPEKISLLLTQYRESPNLIGLIEAYLSEVIEAQDAIKEIPSKFDLDSATGDQLTIIGKWLGFPRTHNVTSNVKVAGFECEGVTTKYNIGGFCEDSLWLGCPGISSFEVSINDDDLYRKFLYVRRYQLLGRNDYKTFTTCISILFGNNATYAQNGRIITVTPGRALTNYENLFVRVFERVLPRAISAIVTITT